MIFIVLLFLLAQPLLGRQDDVDLIFPKRVFENTKQIIFLPSAQAQLRLGRYIGSDDRHGWRGGVEGEITLLGIYKSLLHWGLNMETLVDDSNDIYFRLVQVYYQTSVGVSWPLGPGVWTWGWQHRCSHGADSAVLSRILIRSGLQTSYFYSVNFNPVSLNVRAGADLHVIGQNDDTSSQARGGFSLVAEAIMALGGPWYMLVAGGFASEIRASGKSSVYNLASSAKDFNLDNLFSMRLALRFKNKNLNNDYALLFSQIGDTGFGAHKNKHSGVSFDVNFYW